MVPLIEDEKIVDLLQVSYVLFFTLPIIVYTFCCYIYVQVLTHIPRLVSSFLSFFLSLYTARPYFEYYGQVYFVHSGLQDESLQVTISKLP